MPTLRLRAEGSANFNLVGSLKTLGLQARLGNFHAINFANRTTFLLRLEEGNLEGQRPVQNYLYRRIWLPGLDSN